MPSKEQETTYSLRDALCPICGAGFDSRPVICPGCDTPHHDDCWKYNGGCATYGCQTKEPSEEDAPPPSSTLPMRLPPRLLLPSSFPIPFPWPHVAGYSLPLVLLSLIFFLPALPIIAVAVACLVYAWPLVTRQAYSLDTETKTVTLSSLAFDREINETTVCPLDSVRWLEVERFRSNGRDQKQLVALLRSGTRLPLTQPFRTGTSKATTVDLLLHQLRVATGMRIYTRPRSTPVAEAMAQALSKQLPLSRSSEEDSPIDG